MCGASVKQDVHRQPNSWHKVPDGVQSQSWFTVMNFHLIPDKKLSLQLSVAFLILLSGDVELNPGPLSREGKRT